MDGYTALAFVKGGLQSFGPFGSVFRALLAARRFALPPKTPVWIPMGNYSLTLRVRSGGRFVRHR